MKYKLFIWSNQDTFVEYTPVYQQTTNVVRGYFFEIKNGHPYLVIDDTTIFINGKYMYVPTNSVAFNSLNDTSIEVTMEEYANEWKVYLSKLTGIDAPNYTEADITADQNQTSVPQKISEMPTIQSLKEIVQINNFNDRQQLDSKTIQNMINKPLKNPTSPVKHLENAGWKQVVVNMDEAGNLVTSLEESKKPKQNLNERRFDKNL